VIACRIYTHEWEVEPKLAEFNVSLAEMLHVVEKVVGARDDAVDNDPLGTPGTFAYIFGTRNLRALWAPKGWEKYREENVEAIREPATGRQIIYQNVDLAGTARSPLAIRGKGAGNRRLVDAGQGSLFPDDEIPEALPALPGALPLVWYFCVSDNQRGGERHIGAELSLPLPFKGDNFGGFIQRIIIRPSSPWVGARIQSDRPDDDGPVEFEPKISRK
jgi:hypothetical protein